MNRVKELRLKNKMQQKDIALALHVSQPSISKWEKQISDPTDENVIKLAELLHVAPEEIVYYSPQVAQEPAQDWNPQYPGGVALRRDMSGYKSEHRPAPQGLTMEDLAKIAEYVNNAKPNDAPKTPEARIVSYGMDNLPQEIRERILNIVLATVKGTPEEKYFKEDANK